jgi:hypothetical protein
MGQVLQKYKMGKFVNWSVEDGRLVWRLDQEAIQTDAMFDGCYVVYTDLPAEQMSKEEAVASCRKLSEEAFRNLKTVWLQERLVMASLWQISFNTVRLGKVQFEQLTVHTADQQRLLDLLCMKL